MRTQLGEMRIVVAEIDRSRKEARVVLAFQAPLSFAIIREELIAGDCESV